MDCRIRKVEENKKIKWNKMSEIQKHIIFSIFK